MAFAVNDTNFPIILASLSMTESLLNTKVFGLAAGRALEWAMARRAAGGGGAGSATCLGWNAQKQTGALLAPPSKTNAFRGFAQ